MRARSANNRQQQQQQEQVKKKKHKNEKRIEPDTVSIGGRRWLCVHGTVYTRAIAHGICASAAREPYQHQAVFNNMSDRQRTQCMVFSCDVFDAFPFVNST